MISGKSIIGDSSFLSINSKIVNTIKNLRWQTIIFIVLFSFAIIIILMNTFSNISILTKASDNKNISSGTTSVYLVLNIFILLVAAALISFCIYRLANPHNIFAKLQKVINIQNEKFGIPVVVGPNTTFADSIPSIGKDKFEGLDISNLRPNACKSKDNCSTRVPNGRTIPDPRPINSKCKDAYGSRNLPK